MLSADDILKSPDIGEIKTIKVPEWGGEVCVKVMSGAERDRWEIMQTTALRKNPASANIRAGLCAVTLCDEKGQRLFTDFQIEELGKKSSIALDRIFAVAQRMNKLSNADLEELEKN